MLAGIDSSFFLETGLQVCCESEFDVEVQIKIYEQNQRRIHLLHFDRGFFEVSATGNFFCVVFDKFKPTYIGQERKVFRGSLEDKLV